MALIKCPECDLQVSDKAITCPHCGYPLDKPTATRSARASKKRMRLPNGFGSITQLKDKNLRNPYWARICTGRNEFGSYILKPLKPRSLFATYNEAYAALVEYNRNPYDLDDDITVQQLYDRWSEGYFANTSESYQRTITAAWSFCTSIYDMRAKDLRARHIKGCMDDGYRIETRGKNKGTKIQPSAEIKSRIKSLFNLLLDYAVEYEVVDKNYARTFKLSDEIVKEKDDAKKPHIIFTDDELQVLWDNVGKVPFVDWVLMQCYMGWRPQELATLRLDEIDLDQWYMQAGMKTPSGKQRIVPVHTKVRTLLKSNYDTAVAIGSEHLLNDQNPRGISYRQYAYRFKKVVTELGLNPDHRAHDPRMTFVTRCKRAEVDEYALKEMVGHSIEDITESTYTVRDVEWIRSDLEKMQ